MNISHKKTIIELAKEAGFDLSVDEYNGNLEVDCEGVYYTEVLERFAALVRAEALDEAAKVCEQDEFQIYETAERCAAAIRGLK